MAVRVSLQSSSNDAVFKEISLLTPQSLVPSTTGSRSSPTLDHALTMVILVKTGNRGEVFSQPLGMSGINVCFPKEALAHCLCIRSSWPLRSWPSDTAALASGGGPATESCLPCEPSPDPTVYLPLPSSPTASLPCCGTLAKSVSFLDLHSPPTNPQGGAGHSFLVSTPRKDSVQ